jgi:hypothetical protein
MKLKGDPTTLSDADISSQRKLSRRSLLATLGIGAGVAAAAAFGSTTSVEARDRDTPSRPRFCDRDVTPDGRAYDRTRCWDRPRY